MVEASLHDLVPIISPKGLLMGLLGRTLEVCLQKLVQTNNNIYIGVKVFATKKGTYSNRRMLKTQKKVFLPQTFIEHFCFEILCRTAPAPQRNNEIRWKNTQCI